MHHNKNNIVIRILAGCCQFIWSLEIFKMPEKMIKRLLDSWGPG